MAYRHQPAPVASTLKNVLPLRNGAARDPRIQRALDTVISSKRNSASLRTTISYAPGSIGHGSFLRTLF